MHNTQLDAGLGKGGLDRFREAAETVNAHDEDVIHTAILQVGETAQPELRPLCFIEP